MSIVLEAGQAVTAGIALCIQDRPDIELCHLYNDTVMIGSMKPRRKGNAVSLFIVMVILSACGGRRSNPMTEHYVALDESRLDSSLAERVADISFLALETNDVTQFGSIDKIAFENDLIYIGDYALGKILVFGMDGRSRFVLDRQGRGPGEYLRIQSFAVDDDDLFLLDNTLRRIFVYDCHSGDFRYEVHAPVVAWDMECLGNGDFIFAFAPMEQGGLKKTQPLNRVFVADGDFKIRKKMFEYSKGEFDLLGFPHGRYLYTCGDKLVHGSFKDNGYHLFSRENGEYVETAIFGFKNGIPRRRLLDRSVLDTDCTHLISCPLVCRNYVAFEISMKGFTDWCVYDYGTERAFTNSRKCARNFVFDLIGSYGDSFVGFLQDSVFYSSLTAGGFSRADPAAEAAILRDEPALIFYHMK